jgi:hypothetical protein
MHGAFGSIIADKEEDGVEDYFSGSTVVATVSIWN